MVELGCGNGWDVFVINRRVQRLGIRYVGVDLAKLAFERAANRVASRDPRTGHPMSDVFLIPTKASPAAGNLHKVPWLLGLGDDAVEWRPRPFNSSHDLLIVLGKERAP